MQILTWLIFLVLFSNKNHGFIQEGNLSEKFCYSWGELDGINIDEAANLEDSPRFVFIDEECENLIVVNDGREGTRNKHQKKKSGVLESIDVRYVTNAVGESIFSTTRWNIVNQ